MKPYKNSSRKNLRRGIFVSPSHHMHHHSSLFAKNMAKCDQYKIIGRSTLSPYATSTLFHLSLTSSTTLVTPTYIRNLTSDGGTTTCASTKATRRRPHLKHDMDSLSRR